MTTQYSKKAGATQKLADGGTVGLWERLKAGNIDQEGSEANKRWGSGSKAAAAPAPSPAPESAPSPSPAPAPAAMEPGPMSDVKSDDDTPDYGNESRRTKTASAPAPAPKRRTASAPAKSKTTAADASPSASYGNESPRGAASSPDYGNESTKGKAPRKGMYGGDLDDPIASKAARGIKALFTRAPDDVNDANYFTPKRTVQADSNYVNGGLIGAGTANTVTKSEMSNPGYKDNALGGGRKSYGKK